MKVTRLSRIKISALIGSRSGRLIRYFSLLAIIFIFPACSSFRDELVKKPACFIPSSKQYMTEVEIRDLVSGFQNRNNQLKAFKGIGKFRILEQGKLLLSERMAWIGAGKDRIRIAVLVSGRPAVNIASDGRWIYYQEAGSGKRGLTKKKYSNAAGLEQLIKIPVSLSHIISFLTGRIPIRTFSTVECDSHDEGSRVVLVLKKWWRIVEKIYLAEKTDNVDAVEMYDPAGLLLYRVVFEKMKQLNGYIVPSRIVISNDNGISMQIDINRYMVDIPVTDEMFVLESDKQ